jgi:hypothetical protein
MKKIMESNDLFLKAFHGNLRNILTWADWDGFCQRLQAQSDGWYVYVLAEEVPSAPLSANDFQIFLQAIDQLLRKQHQESYCGIVYADDLYRPNLVKIYDPKNLGAVCGSSGAVVLPGWVLSRFPPVSLPPPQPSGWQKVFRPWFSKKA